MKSALRLLVVGIVFGGISRGALAQQARDISHYSPLNVLRLDSVQKDLDLSSEQRAAVRKLESDSPDPRDVRDLVQKKEALAKLRLELRERGAKNIENILRPEQRERFQQIMLQIRFPTAMLEEPVAGKLQITEQQRDQIRQTRVLGETDSQRRERVMAILSDEQKAELKKLQGNKVEISDAEISFPPRARIARPEWPDPKMGDD